MSVRWNLPSRTSLDAVDLTANANLHESLFIIQPQKTQLLLSGISSSLIFTLRLLQVLVECVTRAVPIWFKWEWWKMTGDRESCCAFSLKPPILIPSVIAHVHVHINGVSGSVKMNYWGLAAGVGATLRLYVLQSHSSHLPMSSSHFSSPPQIHWKARGSRLSMRMLQDISSLAAALSEHNSALCAAFSNETIVKHFHQHFSPFSWRHHQKAFDISEDIELTVCRFWTKSKCGFCFLLFALI